jgi:periplasmic divalent cation tolerance protein
MNDAETDGDRVMVLFCTTPDETTAARIARTLVEERLAACATRIPGAVSIYRFEGAIHEDAEHLLVIKTVRRRVADLERRLVSLHPYDVPECVAVESASVAGPYAAWVRSVTA